MAAATLLVTAGGAIRDRIEKIAAVAEIPLVVDQGEIAAGTWLRAATVMLDARMVPALASAGLPRREGVVVLRNGILLPDEWEACVRLGVSRVLAADNSDEELVEILAQTSGVATGEGYGTLVTVVGACGGAGGSVFAAALAYAAARERRTLLCDFDSTGAGLETMLGMERHRGARWSDMNASRGRIAADSLWQALPALPGVLGSGWFLGHGSLGRSRATGRAGSQSSQLADGATVNAVTGAVRRAGGVVIADVPRYADADSDRLHTSADLIVVVIPAEVRGCYAAATLLPELHDLGARIGAVVRGPSPGEIGPRDIEEVLRVPVLAAMRPQPGLSRLIESGRGLGRRQQGPLHRAAAAVWQQIAEAATVGPTP